MGFFNRGTGLAILLWRGTDGLVQDEKAAWDAVCCPKKESGHVLKRVEEWDKAGIMKFIWLLFTQAESLRVAQVKLQILKGQSFWCVTSFHDCSWGWGGGKF